MSIFNGLGDFFKKLFGLARGFAARSGLDKFLATYWDDAVFAFLQEAKKHPGAAFHEWKPILWNTLKALTKTDKDTWLELLIALVGETVKAKKLL